MVDLAAKESTGEDDTGAHGKSKAGMVLVMISCVSEMI